MGKAWVTIKEETEEKKRIKAIIKAGIIVVVLVFITLSIITLILKKKLG